MRAGSAATFHDLRKTLQLFNKKNASAKVPAMGRHDLYTILLAQTPHGNWRRHSFLNCFGRRPALMRIAGFLACSSNCGLPGEEDLDEHLADKGRFPGLGVDSSKNLHAARYNYRRWACNIPHQSPYTNRGGFPSDEAHCSFSLLA